MVETTQAGVGYHYRLRALSVFDGSAIGCVFVERVMDAVLMIVGDIITDEPPQMFFI